MCTKQIRSPTDDNSCSKRWDIAFVGALITSFDSLVKLQIRYDFYSVFLFQYSFFYIQFATLRHFAAASLEHESANELRPKEESFSVFRVLH